MPGTGDTVDNNKEYATLQVEISPALYHAAQLSLKLLGSSVEEYCALCILHVVRYMHRIPECQEMSQEELTRMVVADVIEMLEICHANRNVQKDDHK